MWIGPYQQERSIRDIMKAFKIPSTATVYKILAENGIQFQEYKKTKNNPIWTKLLLAAAAIRNRKFSYSCIETHYNYDRPKGFSTNS